MSEDFVMSEEFVSEYAAKLRGLMAQEWQAFRLGDDCRPWWWATPDQAEKLARMPS